MKSLGNAALWALSILFILIALLLFTTNLSAALMALLIGVVLLPPMVGFIDHPAFKIVRWGIASMAFGLFVAFVPPSEELQVQQPQASPTPAVSSPNPNPTPTPTPTPTPSLTPPPPLDQQLTEKMGLKHPPRRGTLCYNCYNCDVELFHVKCWSLSLRRKERQFNTQRSMKRFKRLSLSATSVSDTGWITKMLDKKSCIAITHR